MVIWSLQETIRQTTSRSKLEFLFPAKNATKKFKDFVIKKDFFLLTVLVFLSHNKRKAFMNFLSNYFKTSMMIHAKNHPPTDHPAVCLLCLVNFGRYYTIYTFLYHSTHSYLWTQNHFLLRFSHVHIQTICVIKVQVANLKET